MPFNLDSKSQQHSDNRIGGSPMSVVGALPDHALLEG
jgi:hypothetical protein